MPSSDDPQPPPRKPSRSGGDTSRSTGGMINRGGKLDAAAFRTSLGLGPGAMGPEADAVMLEGRPLPPDPDHAQVSVSSEDDAPNRVVFVLQRDLQKRLDKYLTDRIPFMSRTQLQRLIDEGGVSVNARPGKASTKLRINDRVEVFVPSPPPTDVQPQDIPIDVLFEDEHLIVLNKRPDIIVHPARSELSGTLINALAYHFQNRSPSGGALSGVGKEFARPGVVHRLDRNTSGLIVFAKTDEAHWQLGRQFESRSVDKRYLAIAHGLIEPPVDTIDLPLGPHPSREKGYREKYVVRYDNLGKASVTIARVRAHFRHPHADEPGDGSAANARRGFSLVELELKTGRTHQIRVHLSHTGYPIVADDMYGGRLASAADLALVGGTDEPIISRHALHAATLGFTHPISKQPMRFLAPFPLDMGELLRRLRRMDAGAQMQTPPGATVQLDTLWGSAG